MRLEVNAYFRAHPATGSGQYLAHLVDALRAGYPDVHIAERRPSPQLRGNPGKVMWEQLVWPRQARVAAAVRHVPYLAPPVIDGGAVVTAHDVIPYVMPAYGAGWRGWLYGLPVRFGIRRTRHVIADSRATHRDLVRVMAVRVERITVVHLGVDRRFAPEDGESSRASLNGLGLPSRFALYLGSLDVRKNLGVLLQAWPRVWREHRVPLVIAGRSPRPQSAVYANWFGRLDPSSTPWLIRLGPVDEELKPALFREAALFVFPSRYEGFGLEPLEAMASGVPVIAANATSLPEVVGEAGLLVGPDDAAGWEEAANRVLGDAAFANHLCDAGIVRARQFSWEAAATNTYAVYKAAQ